MQYRPRRRRLSRRSNWIEKVADVDNVDGAGTALQDRLQVLLYNYSTAGKEDCRASRRQDVLCFCLLAGGLVQVWDWKRRVLQLLSFYSEAPLVISRALDCTKFGRLCSARLHAARETQVTCSERIVRCPVTPCSCRGTVPAVQVRKLSYCRNTG